MLWLLNSRPAFTPWTSVQHFPLYFHKSELLRNKRSYYVDVLYILARALASQLKAGLHGHGPRCNILLFLGDVVTCPNDLAIIWKYVSPSETFLTLGREFGSRCSHENWDFPSNLKIKFRRKKNMPNKWRTTNYSWVDKIRHCGRRGKGTVESFSR